MVGIGGVDKSSVELNIVDKATPALSKFQQQLKMTDSAIMSSGRNALTYSQSTDRLSNSVKQSSGQLNALGTNYATLNRNIDLSSRSLGTHNTLINQVGKTTQTTSQKMSQFGNFMKNNLTNVSLLAGGIAGLDDQFLGLHKAQVAAERSSLMKEKADQRVKKTQDALNDMIAKGKKGTADYELKVKDLELAQDAAGIATERATVAQETLNERTEDFWIGILPNMIFVGGSAMQMIQNLGINFDKLSGSIGKIKTLISSMPGGLLGGLGLAAGAAIATAIIANQINVLNNYRIANEKIAQSIKNNDWEGVLAGRLQGLKGEFENVFGQAASGIRNTLPDWMRNQDAELRESEYEFLKRREQFRTDFSEFMKSPEWERVLDFAPKLEPAFRANINTLTALLDPNNFDKYTTDPKTGKFSEWYANTWIESVRNAIAQLETDMPKELEKINNILSVDAFLQNARDKHKEDTALFDFMEQEGIKRADDASKSITELSDSTLGLSKSYNTFLQNAPAFNDTLNKSGVMGKGAAAEILGLVDAQAKLAPKISGTTMEILRLDNTMETMATKSAPEWKNAQVDAYHTAKQALEEYKKSLVEKIATSQSNIAQALDIKIKDKEKMMRKIFDYIPDKITKSIKADVKMDMNVKTARDNIMDVLYGALGDEKTMKSDKKMDKVVEGVMKFLAEKFPKSQWAIDARKALAGTLASDDTAQEVAKLMDQWEAAPIPVEISQASLDALTASIQAAISSMDPARVSVKPIFPGGGFNMDSPVVGDDGKIKPVSDVQGAGSGWGSGNSGYRQGMQLKMSYEDGGDMCMDEFGRKVPCSKKKKGKDPLGALIGGYDSSTTKTNPLANANPLDITARQYVQLTKNINVLARATVQLTKDNNILARTVVTLTKDHNLFARTQTQVTRNYNTLARTTVQETKNNNTYARTVLEIAKDHNLLARTQVQLTKNNNTLARTINQVGSNFNDAASDADDFASSLRDVASAAKSAASAIKSIPKPPSGVQRFASGGDFITSGPELIMVGDNPSGKERVQVTPLSGSSGQRTLNSGPGMVSSTFNGIVNVRINGSEIINNMNLSKKIKLTVGEKRDRFG